MRHTILLLALGLVCFSAYGQTANDVKKSVAGAQVYSKNAEANDLFLKGREYYNKSNPRTGGALANAREAIKLYELAIKKDPRFALAYVDLSRAWQRLGYSLPGGMSNKELLPHAKAAALKAVELDKDLLEAHSVLANIYFNIAFDWERAEHEYKESLRLGLNDANVHSSYAGFLASVGRFDEVISEAAKAEQLSRSAATDSALARIYYRMRRYGEAEQYNRRSLKKDDQPITHFGLGFICLAQQKYDEAISEFKRSGIDGNGGSIAALAYANALAGNTDEARRLLEEVVANREKQVGYRIAAVYLALGNKDKAIEWLRTDYGRRDNWRTWLKVDPVMDPLRSDRRFIELMRRMKFPPDSQPSRLSAVSTQLLGEGAGLDHPGILVHDLEAAKDTYRNVLGFWLEPRGVASVVGSGIKISTAFFEDGSYLMLTAVDDLEKVRVNRPAYLTFLEKHEGAKFFMLNVPSANRTAQALRERGFVINDPAPRTITPPDAKEAPPPSIFAVTFKKPVLPDDSIGFAQYTDRDERIRKAIAEGRTHHPNTAKRIAAVWLVVPDLKAGIEAFRSVGFDAGDRRDFPELGAAGREIQAGNGTIMLLQPIAKIGKAASFLADRGEGIMGLSIEVSSLETARALLEKTTKRKFVSYSGPFGKSILVPADLAHGVWIEMFQVPAR